MYLSFSLHDQDTHLAELKALLRIYLRIAGVALARQHF